MKKYLQNKKQTKIHKKRIFETDKFLIVLLLFPLFFAALFQGGYFQWEVYAILLLYLPAIFFFFMGIIKEGKIKLSGEDKGLFLFLAVSFISLFFTVYFHATLTEFYKVLIYVFVFYAALNSVKTDSDFEFVINALLFTGFVLSVLGIIAFIGYKFNLGSGFFAFLINNGFVQGGRISSSLQYANTFAAFIILPFFIAFSYTIKAKKIYSKIAYGILSIFFLITIILTGSRGGLLALILVWIIYLVLLGGEARKEGLLYTGIVFAIGILIIFAEKNLFLTALKNLWRRILILINFAKGGKSVSLSSRESMIKDSLKILKEHPVFGTGNGTYQYVYAKYRSVYFFSRFPHSIFFQVLDELGLVGGAAFVYMLYGIFKKGAQALKEKYDVLSVGLFVGLLGILLHALIDFDWSLMFMPLLFFFYSGVLISRGKSPEITLSRENAGERKSTKTLKRSYKVAALITTVAILFGLFAFPFFGALENFKAKASEGKVPVSKTLSLYKSATDLDPLCSEYHYDLANFYSTKLAQNVINPSDFIKKAIDEYKEAIRHCPEYFLYHFGLGKLYLQIGDKKAIDEFSKTVELNPIDPGAHASLGFAYLKLGNDTVMAKVQFEEALKLDPKNSDAHLGMGMLFEKTGNREKAIEEYRLSVKYNRKNAYAYYRLGILEEETDLPQAIRDLFYAVKYNPNLSDAKKEFEKYGTIVTVLKPSPGETLQQGKDYKIMWLSSKPEHVSYYSIWLIPKKGKSSSIKSGIPGNATSYVWSVPNGLKTGNYKIRIYAVNPAVMNRNLGGWVSYGESEYFVIGRK